MPFVSQDLFDRMTLALVINTDPEITDPRSADAVSAFLHDVRDAFPEDPFTEELFQAARWLGRWSQATFGPENASSFAALRMIYDRTEDFYPSGGRRPSHTSDTQPLRPMDGQRMSTFQDHIMRYAATLPG